MNSGKIAMRNVMDSKQIMTQFCTDDLGTLRNIENVLLPRWRQDLAEAEAANNNGCIDDIVIPMRDRVKAAEARLQRGWAEMNKERKDEI